MILGQQVMSMYVSGERVVSEEGRRGYPSRRGYKSHDDGEDEDEQGGRCRR